MESGLVRPYISRLIALHKVVDVGLIAGVLFLVLMLHDIPVDSRYVVVMLAAGILFQLLGGSTHLYRSWRLSSLRKEISHLVVLWMIVLVILASVAFALKEGSGYSRLVVFHWAILVPTLLMLERLMLRFALQLFRKSGWNSRSLAIAGANPLSLRIIHKATRLSWKGLSIVGIYDDRDEASLHADGWNSKELAGNFQQLVDDARKGKIDFVYVTLPLRDEEKIVKLIGDLADTTASVYVVPSIFFANMMHSRWIDMDGTPLIGVYESPFYSADGWIKRAEDLVLGG
jgi:putative colanic acid biosynthesis UDP-glucose lipid carrier transferase